MLGGSIWSQDLDQLGLIDFMSLALALTVVLHPLLMY
jgi:hypothetical protein